MTYICHDTVKTNAVIDVKGWLGRIAKWTGSLRADHLLDPHNEHLMRDAGVTVADTPAAFKSPPATNHLPYSTAGSKIRFIDLFLSEHLDRGPR